MNLYPRSFLRMVLVGWLLMALPLLVAIAFASLSVTRLSARSEAAMEQATVATRLGWELDEDLVQMERILRQFEVLHDPSLLHDYDLARQEWLRNSVALAAIPLMQSLAGELAALRASEERIPRELQNDKPALAAQLAVLDELKDRNIDVIGRISRLTDAERQNLRSATEALQRYLLIAMGLAFLLAGALFWLSRRVLAGLLRNLERAVIALGNNLLERRIRLPGPRDMRWIGHRLDWLRRRLLALQNERTRILRHVSHELKTPLAALREGASLLNEGVAGPLTPQQARIANIMQGNAVRLQALIDGLLRLQQAEHAREHIQPETLRLDELVQQVLATHKLAARDKQLHITGTLTPLTVRGGREEITTIINNLVANAIKFSPPQGTVRLVLSRSADRRAVLDVFDEGPGIPPAERSMIFEPFYRSPGSKTIAGVGLGLAIAREFALAQHGTLELLDTPAGAHFRATLPLVPEGA